MKLKHAGNDVLGCYSRSVARKLSDSIYTVINLMDVETDTPSSGRFTKTVQMN